MSRHNTDFPLTIELLPEGEDNPYVVRSIKEIQFILKNVAHENARVALYFDKDNSFILTTVLNVDEKGMWLETVPNAHDNLLVAQSKKLAFISSHHMVKVQFMANRVERVRYNNRDAFYLPLPDTLLRIQRRDHYRLPTPTLNPLKCTIPTPSEKGLGHRELVVMDISGGGIALLCDEQAPDLQQGMIYHNCQIFLPGGQPINFSIQIKSIYVLTLPTGETRTRAGCQFINLDAKMAIQLHRYITQRQQNAIRTQT